MDSEIRVVRLSHSLLDEGMFVLQLPLLHGRVDNQLIKLHRTEIQVVTFLYRVIIVVMLWFLFVLPYLCSQFFHIGVNLIQDVEALLEQCILGSHE